MDKLPPKPVSPIELPLLLASASPRRQMLLKQLGILPEAVFASDIDETPKPEELPRLYAKRLAKAKLDAAQILKPDYKFILAADTVAAAGRRILSKTNERNEAEKLLRLLSGRRHRVYTALALLNTQTQRYAFRLVCTIVTFSRLSEYQLQSYLDLQEWVGKAGAYAIQGYAAGFVRSINGSYSNVVGLPLFETAQLLRGQGLIP